MDYLKLTGDDVFDRNLRRIDQSFNFIEVVDTMPDPSESFFGRDRIHNTSAGDVPQVCLKTPGGGFTWSVYEGGVYPGPFGPLVLPVEDFDPVAEHIDDPAIGAKIQNAFNTIYQECQRRNISPICPEPAVYLRGWKWTHTYTDTGKFLICCLDGDGNPYWRGPITPPPPDYDYDNPPTPPDDDPDPDCTDAAQLLIEDFNEQVWEAEGSVGVSLDTNNALEGDGCMFVSKGVIIDDFDDTPTVWTSEDDTGDLSADADNQDEGDACLRIEPKITGTRLYALSQITSTTTSVNIIRADADTGAVEWSVADLVVLHNSYASIHASRNGLYYARDRYIGFAFPRAIDAEVRRIDEDTGADTWSHTTTLGSSAAISVGVAANDDGVFHLILANSAPTVFSAYIEKHNKSTGALLDTWVVASDVDMGTINPSVGVSGISAVRGYVVAAIDYNDPVSKTGTYVCFDSNTGVVQWSKSGGAAVAAHGGSAYALTLGGILNKYDIATGVLVWSVNDGFSVESRNFKCNSVAVYIGVVRSRSVSTGALMASVSQSSYCKAPTSDSLFVGTVSDGLFALDSNTLGQDWQGSGILGVGYHVWDVSAYDVVSSQDIHFERTLTDKNIGGLDTIKLSVLSGFSDAVLNVKITNFGDSETEFEHDYTLESDSDWVEQEWDISDVSDKSNLTRIDATISFNDLPETGEHLLLDYMWAVPPESDNADLVTHGYSTGKNLDNMGSVRVWVRGKVGNVGVLQFRSITGDWRPEAALGVISTDGPWTKNEIDISDDGTYPPGTLSGIYDWRITPVSGTVFPHGFYVDFLYAKPEPCE